VGPRGRGRREGERGEERKTGREEQRRERWGRGSGEEEEINYINTHNRLNT